MAGESDLQEKTEEATPQRREEFRKQGQVAQTRELSSALALLGLSLVVYFMGRLFVEQFFEIYNEMYGKQLLATIKSGNIFPSLSYAFKKIFLLALPVYVVTFVFGVASSVLQIGFLFTNETLSPNLKKIHRTVFELRSLTDRRTDGRTDGRRTQTHDIRLRPIGR